MRVKKKRRLLKAVLFLNAHQFQEGRVLLVHFLLNDDISLNFHRVFLLFTRLKPAFRISYFFYGLGSGSDPKTKSGSGSGSWPNLNKKSKFRNFLAFFGKKNFVDCLCLSKNALNTQILEHLEEI